MPSLKLTHRSRGRTGNYGFWFLFVLVLCVICTVEEPLLAQPTAIQRHAVSKEHPHLLGSLADLRALKHERPEEYKRMVLVARGAEGDNYSRIMSMALVAAIEGDKALAREAQQRVMGFVRGPIRQGHVPFATDLALCGIVYDLCYDAWPEDDRRSFHEYLNRTVDANVQSENHVFHNGWYGYKNWGIGLACYASYYENDRSRTILLTLENEFRTRAGPALELAGAGGGWAEGYYIHYWLYEWLFFCEIARRCEGVDYYAMAPKFFRERAVASMFESYPGLQEYGSRRSVPMGDGGGRLFGGDRDKTLAARRILVSYYRNDPAHQQVHAFNQTTPRVSAGAYAYKDFLWDDRSVPVGELDKAPLSHLSAGPGYVYARSSWNENATYFFFKCGDRFTAHQHLDVGHFMIYKGAELIGDGGHYDEFGTTHDVNFHLRSIAHSTVLVNDPAEGWPSIRAGKVTSNDGGQHHSWPHHNGAVGDAAEWQRGKSLYDIADLIAFADRGAFLYLAGDGTRAYSSNKLEVFIRQIVYLRPDTFVIFDRLKSRKPEFRKTWLLQAMHQPENLGKQLLVTNGLGRLYVQTIFPEHPAVRLVSGDELYRVGHHTYLPSRNTGPAPECRIEISPSIERTEDLFLHVLTAGLTNTPPAPMAMASVDGRRVKVTVGPATLQFYTDQAGGAVTVGERRYLLDASGGLRK